MGQMKGRQMPALQHAIGVASICLVLGGCVSYTPPTQKLPDADAAAPSVIAALGGADVASRQTTMAVRSGRVLRVEPSLDRDDFLRSLPAPVLKQELSSGYVPPYPYRPFKAGEQHHYNFTVTVDFEQAMRAYLSGQSEQTIAAAERILAGASAAPTLLWQASNLRLLALELAGRYDLAESELSRTERYEIEATGQNHAARSMRAEIRFWSGDLAGAARDATQVVRSIGDWRYPTAYPAPMSASEKVELARITTAQVRAQNVLGLVLLARGRPVQALPWLELADQTTNNGMWVAQHPLMGKFWTAPEEMHFGRGLTLTLLGIALLATDPDSGRADQQFARAEQYFAELGFRAGPAMIGTFKAFALYNARRHAEAATQAETALVEAQKLGLLDYQWRLQTVRGVAFAETGRWDAAERAFRAAQGVVDQLASTMPMDESRTRFGIGKEAITQYLSQIDLRNNDIPRLFEDVERGRARAFVSSLAMRVIATGREEAITGDIRNIDRQIQAERQRKNSFGNSAGNVDDESRMLEERAGLVARLRARDPDLADALAVSAVALESVQRALPAGTAMFYMLPAEGTDRVRFIRIAGENAKVIESQLSATALASLLDDFSRAVDSRSEVRQREVLGLLRDRLGIDGWGVVRSAYVVPSGRGHFIPWGALDAPYPVAVLPNGGWITRSTAAVREARAAVLGDPQFGGLLDSLPGARAEARSLAQRYGTDALIGERATEAELRARIGEGVDVLHLATHALFDPVFPLQSSLILSDGKRAVPLTAETLFQRPLVARLVVLSACETGMGKVLAGDEVLGLSRSFYLGGTAAVMSSLWPVEDEATRQFMEIFHERSRTGDYGAAWLAARDAVRAKNYPPSAYGAFVLGGRL
jgi:tetratricopeptide (TPR) repeat protein